jgi:hypothetical protein
MRPGLEEIEVPLPGTSLEVVSPALEEETGRGVEAERGVGSVDLLLDDEMAAADLLEGDRLEVVVARLEAGSLEVPGPGILRDGKDHVTRTTAT